MAGADAEAVGEPGDVAHFERARVDQLQRPADRRPRAVPGQRERGRFRPAAAARPKPIGLRGGGARIVAHVLRQRLAHRTDRTAIDPGGQHGDEDETVEDSIVAVPDALAVSEVEAANVHWG